MAKNSMYSVNKGKEISSLCRKIVSNSGFITSEDIEILKHLAHKGDYSDKKAILTSTSISPL